MRLLTTLFCATLAFGQGPVPSDATSLPSTLVSYFNLSGAQANAISKLRADFDLYADQKSDRISLLESQVRILLRAPSPSVSEIGTRIVEIETISRDLDARYGQTVTAINNLFDDGQRAKLKTLLDAIAVQPVIEDALDWYVIDQAVNPSNRTTGDVTLSAGRGRRDLLARLRVRPENR